MSDSVTHSQQAEYYNKAKNIVNKVTSNMLYTSTSVLTFMSDLVTMGSPEDSFHVYDLAKLVERYQTWNKFLPDIKPFYAIKTNHDPVIIQMLASLGLGFDCASIREINLALSAGAKASQIIFAHPRKSENSIYVASQLGIEMMTFDSIEELNKICAIAPRTKLILRIKTDDKSSLNPLSTKFGASLSQAKVILNFAHINKIDIKGISFHIGSNAKVPGQYEKALNQTLELIELAKLKYNMPMDVINLGGGWPGNNDILFEQMSTVVNNWLAKHPMPNIKFMAEPGRFFAAQIMSSAMKIIGKEIQNKKHYNHISYYLADGSYGSYFSSFYYRYNYIKLKEEGWNFTPLFPKTGALINSTLWGPTCDSGDYICKNWPIQEMDTGEYIYSDHIGAYTIATQTAFNGIEPSKAYYIWTQP